MEEPNNPYEAPSAKVPNTQHASDRSPRMYRYIVSLLLLALLSAVFSPGDGGVWLNWALFIEFTTYSIFILVQMFVSDVDTREWAIEHGPKLCFIASIAFVAFWSIFVESGILPHPG
jgi:hypothetical protein